MTPTEKLIILKEYENLGLDTEFVESIMDDRGFIPEHEWEEFNPYLHEWDMECSFGVTKFRPVNIYPKLKSL